MFLYLVTVKVELFEYYEVNANTSEEALSTWSEGDFIEQGGEHINAEPLTATLIET